jgi:hypothetical protein
MNYRIAASKSELQAESASGQRLEPELRGATSRTLRKPERNKKIFLSETRYLFIRSLSSLLHNILKCVFKVLKINNFCTILPFYLEWTYFSAVVVMMNPSTKVTMFKKALHIMFI